MVHARAILLGLRRGLDLYVNYRPVALEHGDVHIYRENTQGLYVGVGGTIAEGNTARVAIDECVYTRDTVQKFVRFCLSRVSEQGLGKVTLVHKSNAVPNTGRLWQEVFQQELVAYSGLTASEEYVDSFCHNFVRAPSRYEGVLASNLFGDIISDIGAALMGGLGLAASASICPETGFGLFEPVHGSAPDIAGQGVANPYAAAMSMALMLDHFEHAEPAAVLRRCVAEVDRTADATPDLGGSGTTDRFMAAVSAA